ncbi:MAG: hypothetical protein AAFQ33_00855, partial [Pseudomonadota bacterium]
DDAVETLTPADEDPALAVQNPDPVETADATVIDEPEEVAALTPDPVDDLTPEPAETVTPVEDIAELEPETLAPVEDEVLAPAEDLFTLQSDTITALDDPLPPEEEIAALVPDTLEPEVLSGETVETLDAAPVVVPEGALQTAEPLSPLGSTGQDRVVETVAVARAVPVAPARPVGTGTAPADGVVTITPGQGQALRALGADVVAPRDEPVVTVESEDTPSVAVAPVEAEPETLVARQSLPDRTLPAPRPTTEPATPPAAPPQDPALTALLERIRDRLADACLLALPENQPSGTPRVTVIAAQESALRSFTEEVVEPTRLDTPVDNRQVFVDERQCPALRFARSNARYPGTPVTVGLARAEIESGDALVGVLGNVAGRYTSLLIVDDNGVVQNLRRFVSFSGGEVTFDVPMTRSGPSRDTSQLLVVLATDGRPRTVTEQAGQLAEDFFAALETELGTDPLISIVPFRVR